MLHRIYHVFKVCLCMYFYTSAPNSRLHIAEHMDWFHHHHHVLHKHVQQYAFTRQRSVSFAGLCDTKKLI